MFVSFSNISHNESWWAYKNWKSCNLSQILDLPGAEYQTYIAASTSNKEIQSHLEVHKGFEFAIDILNHDWSKGPLTLDGNTCHHKSGLRNVTPYNADVKLTYVYSITIWFCCLLIYIKIPKKFKYFYCSSDFVSLFNFNISRQYFNFSVSTIILHERYCSNG